MSWTRLATLSAVLLAQSVLATPTGGEIFWAVGFVEGTRMLKSAYEERFPKYADQNNTAFEASSYSRTCVIRTMRISRAGLRYIFHRIRCSRFCSTV
jgi:hypothetical protein